MRSITTLDLQYAHRFYGFKGEAQYLHGHTGVLTIEVEDSVEPGVNMVFPCNEIQKTAWEVLKNFDHALILREDDPLLLAVLKVYEEQGSFLFLHRSLARQTLLAALLRHPAAEVCSGNGNPFKIRNRINSVMERWHVSTFRQLLQH